MNNHHALWKTLTVAHRTPQPAFLWKRTIIPVRKIQFHRLFKTRCTRQKACTEPSLVTEKAVRILFVSCLRFCFHWGIAGEIPLNTWWIFLWTLPRGPNSVFLSNILQSNLANPIPWQRSHHLVVLETSLPPCKVYSVTALLKTPRPAPLYAATCISYCVQMIRSVTRQ